MHARQARRVPLPCPLAGPTTEKVRGGGSSLSARAQPAGRALPGAPVAPSGSVSTAARTGARQLRPGRPRRGRLLLMRALECRWPRCTPAPAPLPGSSRSQGGTQRRWPGRNGQRHERRVSPRAAGLCSQRRAASGAGYSGSVRPWGAAAAAQQRLGAAAAAWAQGPAPRSLNQLWPPAAQHLQGRRAQGRSDCAHGAAAANHRRRGPWSGPGRGVPRHMDGARSPPRASTLHPTPRRRGTLPKCAAPAAAHR
jgi:hypothetical protein